VSLQRRKPLKRGGAIKRKARPVPKSVYQQVLARDLGCKGSNLPGKCAGRIDPHHILMRSQGGLDTLDNLVSLCRTHHSWVHQNPEESYRLGFLKHDWQ
jgi:hypothetical protein